MVLPHRYRTLPAPFPILVAERRISITVRMAFEVFQVQQLQRHPRTVQFRVEVRHVRHRAVRAVAALRTVESRIEEAPRSPGAPLTEPDLCCSHPALRDSGLSIPASAGFRPRAIPGSTSFVDLRR